MERFDTYTYSIDTTDYSPISTTQASPSRLSPTASMPITSSSNELLSGLSHDLFSKLQPSLRSVFLSAEQYLYMQDDRLDYVYFPETAVVSEFRTLDDGRMVEVSLTGHEGAVGFLPLFCHSRVTNCTQVSQAGSAIRIESEILSKMLRLYPELGNALAPQVDQYVRQISQRSICNMYHSVKERLCTWLLLAQDRSGKQTMKLTHEQIARILGVYRPSVTCIALEMRKKKLINYSRGGLSICDREKLEESACTCYHELAPAY
ncbi:MAG: Crp/Fnr family transcriptional regulator [Acidobacteria bacterium]|nr:Crp/Fnr family transcriptional regulator [Acidobacteriota bacterium]